MSTFNGIVEEFPNIRIDYFRRQNDKPSPAACFLSHVHSDHLQGLESLKMPFVYCSTATKRLLLRMEKYPHRINFAKGILEARKQHYRHLKLVLRALPLQTPVELELGPKSRIQVTLFDANHCPGAVVFLIEGDGKAILYTGDVRSEVWWINTITQSPFVLPYITGLKSLDCMYLDTTFASCQSEYKVFPSKSSGIEELLHKVSGLPQDTILYVKSWTLGYENVWLALSNYLRSKVHVDEYQLRLFAGLAENGRENYVSVEAPSLVGHIVGHSDHPGCLTDDSNARIHSCEPGTACYINLSKKKNVVWIVPIVSRLDDGTEIQEVGAGGGLGDLYQVPELEFSENATLEMLDQLFADTLKDKESLQKARSAVAAMQKGGSSKLSLAGLELSPETETTLQEFVRLISSAGKNVSGPDSMQKQPQSPEMVHFPYSRHSSYEELRQLVSVFRPKDVCACTVELDTWSERESMEALFGDLCSAKIFHHDSEVRAQATEIQQLQHSRKISKRKREDYSHSPNIEEDISSEIAFASALNSPNKALTVGSKTIDTRSDHIEHLQSKSPHHQFSDSLMHDRVERNFQPQSDKRQGQLEQVKSHFHAINNGNNIVVARGSFANGLDASTTSNLDSQTSVDTSQIESQPEVGDYMLAMHCDTKHIIGPSSAGQLDEQPGNHGRSRYPARKIAYEAAYHSLQNNDSASWYDLMLRSTGSRGHTDHEPEL